MQAIFKYLLLALLVWPATLYAQNPPPPQRLYHWTKLENLESIAIGKEFAQPWSEFRRKNPSILMHMFPRIGESLLFAWTNPVTGMLAGTNERYGDTLIELQVDVDPKRVLYLDGTQPHRDISFENIDLVYFKTDRYQEWVIRNPAIVKSFTADPHELKSTLKPWSRAMLDPHYQFPAEELHSSAFNDERKSESRTYAISVIRDLLKSRGLIPSYFLRDEGGRPTFDKPIDESKRKRAVKAYRNNPTLTINTHRLNKYTEKISNWDAIAKNGAMLSELIREFDYRMNVATEFRNESEVAASVKKFFELYNYGIGSVRSAELSALRERWLRSEIGFSKLMEIAVPAVGGELTSDSAKAIEGVKILEQKLKAEMSYSISGVRLGFSCRSIFSAN